MSRFLFVVLPLAAHSNAALAVGRALTDDGHEVAWCGPESYLRPLVGHDAIIHPTGMRYYREYAEQGMAAVRVLWEGYLIPFARFIMAAVDRAVIAYRPDVVVVDQYAFAGALVAHRHALRWAGLCAGGMELTQSSPRISGADEWVDGQLARVWAMADMVPDEKVDLRFSPYLVLGLTSTALTGAGVLPDNCELVGPTLGPRPTDPDFDYGMLDPDRRHVLVTVGTLSAHMSLDFYARITRAMESLGDRVQAIVVGPTDAVPDAPARVRFVPRVPMLDLMPRLDAVVCHGGLGTVGEALAFGIPLVIAPIRHDQPIVADQVVAAGAGIRVGFDEATPAELAAAVSAVLDDPGYRAGAARVRASFAAAGGAPAAARHLADLAAAPR